ncbi:MAG: PqqD family protein [Ruminococcus sp.]|nr:PqqD family protein [Candidatus Copronaster equi]
MKYKLKDGFVVRKIGPQTMAVPIGERTSEIHGLIALNETGEYLWNILRNGADKETLVQSLIQEYEVNSDLAAEDVNKFIDMLKEQGVLADV